MNNGNKIIVNTAVSYVSLLMRMVIGLFSVRFVLQALGEEDYGIYIIVGGIVALLDILNTNMSNTSMRFLAYSLGSKNREEILKTFNTTVFIHYIIGIATIVLLEVGGVLMFEYVVNIPEAKMYDARIIYQFMIVSTFISIISVPYDAVTNAHEKIWVLSLFDVLNSCMTLGLALLLLVSSGNLLLMYGGGLLFIQCVMRFLKVSYAKKKFSECRKIQRSWIDRERIKEIVSFTGWNLFGSLASLGVTQIRSLVLNVFFGVRLNASEGITRQVISPLNMIVTSMTRAINPQIMKSEGGEDRDRMKRIVVAGSKYSTYLFALFGIPVLIEVPFLMDVWLKEVPEFVVIFCQLSIVGILMEKFTFQITQAINAVGNIRNYQVVGSICSFIYLPVAWWMFHIGYSPVTIYVLSLASNFLFAIIRFYYGNKVAEINPLWFIKNAVIPVLVPLVLASLIGILLNSVISQGFLNLIVVSLSFCLSFTLLFWLLGIDKDERLRWKNIVIQLAPKLKKIIVQKNKWFYGEKNSIS